ncbi:MAG: LacI family DNA-binding transcriptional regulator [Kiritimatiellae bacterium]|nr:LacI family DNA-binding transcriptional regulator [Kiritimatiellia bacterium]
MVSQKMIAERLGITHVAVSKALRGHRDIGRDTIARVRATAEAMGYRPNRIARSLAQGRTNLIGALLPTFHDNLYATLLTAMETRARRQGYMILPCQWNEDFETDDHDLAELMQYRVEGIAVVPRFSLPWPQTVYARLLTQHTKLLFVAPTAVPLPGAVNVLSDIRAGACMATDYLIRRGHRRILFVNPWPAFSADGYTAALRQAGLPVREEYIVQREHDAVLGSAEEALKAHPEVTAVFCINDHMALKLIESLTRAGRSVPGDLSVVGFGDVFGHRDMLRLPLTTVSQSPTDQGVAAIERLIAMIEGREPREDCLIPCRLVEGATVADGPAATETRGQP